MLMRFLAVAVIALLLDACDRLSPNERRVVGTWVVHTIDSDDYTIVRPNHTYEEVSNLGSKELELLCLGHWRIEGEDIVTECSTPVPPGLEKEIHNPTYSHRYPIDLFLKGFEPHAPISYKSP
jgi:hypothetical protein